MRNLTSYTDIGKYLKRDSRIYTALTFEGAVYHFKRVPFGLKNAGSAFMRAFRNALNNISPCTRRTLRNYIDDMLIGTKTFDDHILALEEIFSVLIKFNFTLNISKCEFF